MIESRLERSQVQPRMPENLRVIEADPIADPRWLSFLLSHPEPSIFHHPAWISALRDEYPQVHEHLACKDSTGRFLAILPLVRTRGLPLGLGGALHGKRYASLPRTPLGGPLSMDTEATVAILREAQSRVRSDRGSYLQIKRCRPDLDGLVEGMVRSPWRDRYVLLLPDKSQGPFRIANSKERIKIRWAVNRAAKLGLTVRPAEKESDLEAWYVLYLQTMRRSAVPPRSYRFFRSLWMNLVPLRLMELLVADCAAAGRNRIIAGSVFLKLGGTVTYAFNGMDRKYASLRANDAIQWRAINAACDDGFATFDFGEVPHGHAELARFKAKWGAQPERLYRYYTPIHSEFHDQSSESYRKGLKMVQTIWQHLPLSITAWLGGRIYNYL